jgi:NADP-dependent aldehyde dehydrogenase
MSSVNPVFILPGLGGERMSEIASGLQASATLGVGQFCTNPGIVFYPRGEGGESLVASYVGKMKETASSPMLHQGIRKAYGEGLESLGACQGVEALVPASNESGEGGCHAGPCVLSTDSESFLANERMVDEVFGPSTLLVSYETPEDLLRVADSLEGQLTASLFGEEQRLPEFGELLDLLETKAGRLLFNQFPTGVEVCQSVVHGGPYPATTDGRSTSVGTGAILRFARPVCYQGFPDNLLPEELKEGNPTEISRTEA